MNNILVVVCPFRPNLAVWSRIVLWLFCIILVLFKCTVHELFKLIIFDRWNFWNLNPVWRRSPWQQLSYHRIDTRPEGTLLCVLAWEKRPKFFYVLLRHPGVHTALCTYVFLWKTSVCTPGWRQMMAYFHVSTRTKFRTKYRLSDTSGPVSILWSYVMEFN
jgi:hypothetical protein